MYCSRCVKVKVYRCSVPTTTRYCPGRDSDMTQWAAVTMYSGVMSEPPHVWNQELYLGCFLCREICHGHELGTASVPATTRAPAGRFPHPLETITHYTYTRNTSDIYQYTLILQFNW